MDLDYRKYHLPRMVLGVKPTARNFVLAQTYSTLTRMTYKYEPTEPSIMEVLSFDLYIRDVLVKDVAQIWDSPTARGQSPSDDMGQHLCVLKSFRVADKDARSPSALNESFDRKMPPKAECAVSTSNERIGVESSLLKTSSEASHSNRVPGTDPARTTLLRLPTEIVLDLASYLPPSSYMSLSYSCRRIREKMGASIAHLLGDTASMCQSSADALSPEVRNIRFLERWKLLCMLDRDGKPPLSKTFCGGCEQAVTEPSKTWLAQLVKERRCLGTAGLVWICPRQILEYGEATTSMARDGHECEGIASYIGGAHCLRLTGCGRYITVWPIMRVVPNCVPSSEEVNETLGPLDAPVCPHLRLNDARVASAYSQVRQLCRRRNNRRASEPPMAVICNFCSTEIRFRILDASYGPGTLYITILREFTKVQSCTDSAWICHVADPADFEEYVRAWQASIAECRRKLGVFPP